LAGFGLSLAKWTLIVKRSTDLVRDENAWLWWLVLAFGFLICIRAMLQFRQIKQSWPQLSGQARERLFFFYWFLWWTSTSTLICFVLYLVLYFILLHCTMLYFTSLYCSQLYLLSCSLLYQCNYIFVYYCTVLLFRIPLYDLIPKKYGCTTVNLFTIPLSHTSILVDVKCFTRGFCHNVTLYHICNTIIPKVKIWHQWNTWKLHVIVLQIWDTI